MKKIFGILIACCLFLFCLCNCVFADSVEIDVKTDVYDVDISVVSDISEPFSIQVYCLTYDNAEANYKMEDSPIAIGESEVESYKDCFLHRFSKFNVSNSPAEMYRVFLNGEFYKDFRVAEKTELIEFYNLLNDKPDGEIEQYLLDNSYLHRNDMNDYPDDVSLKRLFSKCISEIPFQILDEQSSYEDIKTNVSLLESEFNRCKNLVSLLTEKSSLQNVLYGIVSLEEADVYFITSNNIELDADKIVARLNSDLLKSFEKKEFKQTFDMSVLLTVIEQCDITTITKAINFYNERCINITGTNVTYNPDITEKNDAINYLKNNSSKLLSKEDVEKYYEDGVKRAKQKNHVPTGGGNSSGGGGGSSSGRGSSSVTGVVTSGNSSVTQDNIVFDDLDRFDWAKDSILYLAENEIVSGKGNNKFCPGENITREEFVKIIVEAFDFPLEAETMIFKDVETERWSNKYIVTAKKHGLIFGKTDDEFFPSDNILRQEMAVIMCRIADNVEYELSEGIIDFADSGEIDDYAKSAVSKLYTANIINGTGNNCFSPKKTLTRAETAKVVYEFMLMTGR